MNAFSELDLAAAHRRFSVDYFNAAWELMERELRSNQENEQMLFLSIASHWHWMQRTDYDATKASIGYWLTSRIYCLLNQPLNARDFGRRALAAAQQDGVEVIYRAYAFETLAHAAALMQDVIGMMAYLRHARRAADEITDQEEKQRLLLDLESIALVG
ncbi:MAG TPA: hypothetical protein VLS48_02935 [Anaerolineales bacterium]|nr:hypothetical protein [Anaerolineales bacterium]